MGKIVLDSPTIDATLITAELLSTLFSMYLRPSMVPRTTAFYNVMVETFLIRTVAKKIIKNNIKAVPVIVLCFLIIFINSETYNY